MRLLALVSLGLTLVAPAVAYAQPAPTPAPQEQPAPAPSDQPQPAPGQPADPGRVEFIAEQLRADPVFVSDHVPRAVGPADAERIRETAAATGVPTYLVVLPDASGEPRGEALLAALHDRLGADGLYVELGASGTTLEAVAFGHDLPTAAAAGAAALDPAAGTGPTSRLERFVEVLTSGEAETIYQEASREGGQAEPLLEPEERAFLTGAAASGVPLAALAVVLLVRRARQRRRAPEPVAA